MLLAMYYCYIYYIYIHTTIIIQVITSFCMYVATDNLKAHIVTGVTVYPSQC